MLHAEKAYLNECIKFISLIKASALENVLYSHACKLKN